MTDTTDDQETHARMATSRRAGAIPWLVAGVAGVVLAALLLVYFAFLLPDKDNADDIGDLNANERAAVTAAKIRMVNLTSYRAAHFDADWARAVAGTTGTLHTELDTATEKANTQKELTTAKSDIGATITQASLEGPAGKGGGYIVLLSFDSYQATNKAQTVPGTVELTVVKKGHSWLASDVQSVGVTGS